MKVLSGSVLWAAQGDGHKLGLNREENKKMTANDGGGDTGTQATHIISQGENEITNNLA